MMNTTNTSTWWNRNVTLEEIMASCKKLLKEHKDYTYAFCIGFIDTTYYKEDGDTHVWVSTENVPRQNGKPYVLMKAGSPIHKKLLKLEEEEDIHFERLTDETMRKINEYGVVIFTNEDGTYHNLFEYEPIFKLLSKFDMPVGFYPKSQFYTMCPSITI